MTLECAAEAVELLSPPSTTDPSPIAELDAPPTTTLYLPNVFALSPPRIDVCDPAKLLDPKITESSAEASVPASSPDTKLFDPSKIAPTGSLPTSRLPVPLFASP